MLNTAAAITDSDVTIEGKKIWSDALDEFMTDVPLVFMLNQKAGTNHAEYTTLHGMDDTLISTASMHKAANKPGYYTGVKIRALYEFMVSSFSGEDVLKEEVIWNLWTRYLIIQMTRRAGTIEIPGWVSALL